MLIVGNWKAYVESEKKAKQLVTAAKKAADTYKKVRVVVAPPAPYIALLADGKKSKLYFASQDVSEVISGPHTGESTAAVLSDAGVQYSIVGHSERRAKGESDELISLKTKQAISEGIIPILCIGERERDVDAQYLSFVRAQIAEVMKPLSPKERAQVIFAYEPVWAIGKSADQSVTPEDLTEMVLYIRKALGEYLPAKSAAQCTIIYGGAVEPSNAQALAEGTGIQGFLVGHASADPKSFTAIIKAVA